MITNVPLEYCVHLYCLYLFSCVSFLSLYFSLWKLLTIKGIFLIFFLFLFFPFLFFSLPLFSISFQWSIPYCWRVSGSSSRNVPQRRSDHRGSETAHERFWNRHKTLIFQKQLFYVNFSLIFTSRNINVGILPLSLIVQRTTVLTYACI